MSRTTLTGVRSLGVAITLILGLQFLQPHAGFAAGTITLNPTQAPRTAPVNVTGSGYQTGETVKIIFSGTGTVATTTAAGASGGIAVTFNVPAAATAGGHTVTAVGQTSGISASAPFQVLVGTATTIHTQKSVSADGGADGTNIAASVGSKLTYEIEYNNTGPVAATNVRLVDTLAAGQSFVSASAACTPTTSGGVTTVFCVLGTVPKAPTIGSAGTVTIVTQVDGTASTIQNQAVIYADNVSDTATNVVTVTVGTVAVGTTLSKTVSVNGNGFFTTGSANPGDTLYYDVDFTNPSSSATAVGVTIYDRLQPGQTLLAFPATSSECNNYNAATGLLRCPIGNVAPGGSVDIRIAVVVVGNFFSISNQAYAVFQEATVYSNTTLVSVGGGTVTQTGIFQLCGAVTFYSGNSITVSGVTVPVAPGVIIQGAIANGSNLCIAFTFNGFGQAAVLSVTSNLAGIGVACGIYSPTGSFATINLNGITIASSNAVSFQPFLVPGGYYCFLLTPGGVAYSILSNIPTSITLGSGGHAGRQMMM